MRQKIHFFSFFLSLAVFIALPVFGATITVMNTNDSGAGSLRQAVADTASGDMINFSATVTGTVMLSSTLTIDKNMTISGPGASTLAISGKNSVPVFFVDPGVTVAISGLTIENGFNMDSDGGGILNKGLLTLTNSVISDNNSIQGAGITNFRGAVMTVTNSTISGNNAFDDGGAGIANFGTLTVTDSIFSGNGAYSGPGGGIQNNGTLTVTNSTFVRNFADSGGGIYNGAAMTVTSSTFVSNYASFGLGGGIYNDGALTVKSTLLANSIDGGNCSISSGTFISQGYNLSDDASCSGFTGTGDLNNTPAGLDPSGPQNNGGPTQTIALLPTSAAMDAILVSDCTGVGGALVTSDQRGVTRPQGPKCDIGAFELAPTVVPAVCGDGSCNGTETCSTCPTDCGTCPTIFVSPLDHNFGSVTQGSSSKTLVPLTNLGANSLTVNSIDLNTGNSTYFSLVPVPVFPFSLAPNQNVDIGIAFAPMSLGDFNSIFRINSTDPNNSLVDVSFSGTGVKATIPPSQQIQDILALFDTSIANGTLQGDGPGNSANGRRDALRNMLNATGDMITKENIDGACQQLRDSYLRTDGKTPPPDFVKGLASPTLANMIQDLMTIMGCN